MPKPKRSRPVRSSISIPVVEPELVEPELIEPELVEDPPPPRQPAQQHEPRGQRESRADEDGYEADGAQTRDTVIIGSGTTSAAGDHERQRARLMVVRAERPAPSYLLECMGADVGRRHPLHSDRSDGQCGAIRIGRDPRCDIRVDDDRVSSLHAEIVRGEDRDRLVDRGSSNGTLINGQRIDEIDLHDGDLIQVGYTVFRYVSGVALAPAHSFGMRERNDDTRRPPRVPPNVADVGVDGFGAGGNIGAHMPRGWQRVHARVDDDEVSFAAMVSQLRRFIDFFWPYRKIIASLAAVGFVVGAVSAALFPPQAAAYFDVRLHSKASENPLERFESANVEFFRSAATTFRSTGLIQKTLEQMGEKAPSAQRLQTVQEQLVFDNTGSDPNAQTYMGQVRGPTSEWSLQFLQKHVELYLQGEIEKTLKIIRAQVEFLKGQLADTEKDLRSTEEKLLAFKKQNIDGLPDQARQYYDYLFELQKKESELATEINRTQAEAAVDARRLKTETPLVESRTLMTRPYQQAIVDVNRQLAEARANGLADEHPDVKQLKSKLAELKRLASDAEKGTDDTEVERSRNPIYDDTVDRLQRLRAQAAATHQERERLRQDQERIKAIVDKLPKLEAEYADLTRSYDATKQLHTRIFDQLKTAQLQYELEKASASARYEIITPPRLEYVSQLKNLVKRSLILLVVGTFFGFAFAALMQVKNLLRAQKQKAAAAAGA